VVWPQLSNEHISRKVDEATQDAAITVLA